MDSNLFYFLVQWHVAFQVNEEKLRVFFVQENGNAGCSSVERSTPNSLLLLLSSTSLSIVLSSKPQANGRLFVAPAGLLFFLVGFWFSRELPSPLLSFACFIGALFRLYNSVNFESSKG